MSTGPLDTVLLCDDGEDTAATVREHIVGRRYNVLLLYDDASTHVRTITEHIEAFQRYSGHQIVLIPATGHIPGVDDEEATIDFNAFDALVIYYSVRLSIEEHLSGGIAKAIVAYDGPKLLYIQDEYENTENARRWIERLISTRFLPAFRQAN